MVEIFVTNFANIWDKKKQLRAGELITVFLFSTMNDKYSLINYKYKEKNNKTLNIWVSRAICPNSL